MQANIHSSDVSVLAGSIAPTELEISGVYLVRVGCLGQVGRYKSVDFMPWRRGMRAVCQTGRGIEVGTVLGPATFSQPEVTGHTDERGEGLEGQLLRPMGPEDELLWAHLQELGDQAWHACREWLQERQYPEVLIEVEPLFDGQTLFFHFLSEVGPHIHQHLEQLVEEFERVAANSEFAKLLEKGCGPECGTENAQRGCGSKSGCASCRVVGHCKK